MNTLMTKKQKELVEWTKDRLQEELSSRDTELAHARADTYLCKLLIAFKCKEVTDLFDKLEKWYA